MTQENYPGFREKFTYLSSNLYPIQCGQPDVEQDQIWLQFQRSLNRFQSIGYFADDPYIAHSCERRADESPKRCKIFDDENANR